MSYLTPEVQTMGLNTIPDTSSSLHPHKHVFERSSCILHPVLLSSNLQSMWESWDCLTLRLTPGPNFWISECVVAKNDSSWRYTNKRTLLSAVKCFPFSINKSPHRIRTDLCNTGTKDFSSGNNNDTEGLPKAKRRTCILFTKQNCYHQCFVPLVSLQFTNQINNINLTKITVLWIDGERLRSK